MKNVVISGGAGQHDLVRQLLADASGKAIVTTRCAEPVLLGAAILGAVAGGCFPDIHSAMAKLSSTESIVTPTAGAIARIHAERYKGFKLLQGQERALREV